MKKVKCNKCGFVGYEDVFKKGKDFMQIEYIAGCPKCDNWQSPGDASMRMFGGDRPFSYVRADAPDDPLGKTLHDAGEAS